METRTSQPKKASAEGPRDVQEPFNTSLPSASQCVEDIGFGPTQWVLLLLGTGGISFCDGAEVVALSVVREATKTGFQLGANQTALLMTLVSVGMLGGTLLSGYFGDAFGRRMPVILSYALITVFGFLSALAPNYVWLLVFRLMLGVGIGGGIPPSIVLLSESTPERWRILMRASAYIFWNAGGIYTSFVAAAVLHPNFDGLHWRWVFFYCNIPTAFFLVLSVFLPESPVYLANTGRLQEAGNTLKWMQRWNGAWHAQTDCSAGSKVDLGGGADGLQGFGRKLWLVFSSHGWYTTAIVAYASFCVNLNAWGYSWISPYAMTESGGMPAAWDMVISQSISFGIIVVLFFIADTLPRKAATLLSLIVGAIASAAFSLGGGHSAPRPWFLDALFFFGQNFQSVASTLGYMVIYQIAVEIYPTEAAATGSSFIAGCGRLGSLLAPLLVENVLTALGDWTWSLYVLSCFSVSAFILMTLVPPLLTHQKAVDSPKAFESDSYGSTDSEVEDGHPAGG